MILYSECYREADMACAYGLDLRRRVVGAIEGGLSTRAAARRFAIGISTAGSWYRRWRTTGDLRPGRQGQPKRSKLDIHEAFIFGLVADNKDIALHEIAERLVEEHELRVAPSTVWHFFAKRGITYKKRRRMRRNSSVPTSLHGDKSGSTASLISNRIA
jgi:transposase